MLSLILAQVRKHFPTCIDRSFHSTKRYSCDRGHQRPLITKQYVLFKGNLTLERNILVIIAGALKGLNKLKKCIHLLML